MKPTVYLAGPITGETVASANDWRGDMTERLARHGIVGISPLRAQPVQGERYDLHFPDPCFGMPKTIVSKNYLDVKRCDFVLAYFPEPPEVAELDGILDRMGDLVEQIEERFGPLDSETQDAVVSDVAALKRIARRGLLRTLGTTGEVSWTKPLGKPCAIVTDDPFIEDHPFMSVQADYMLSTFDEAERLIVGLFADYAR
ncbi:MULTISPECIES: hypothetical protein [unclassified Bradyrhizobium]|uniref:hypothetical protein n=1 Tax=unclassified Bradyrhizobium TaxID=2631580 RepID=UPI0028E85455|nr:MULTISPECIES: hypothetical protein [unclassified Bradyrhizobium]